MAGINKNLCVDDRVVVVDTSDINLDGIMTGTVLGTSFNFIHKSHIVLLDSPYNGEKAISITEACLEKL
jgi:hypothetical protein